MRAEGPGVERLPAGRRIEAGAVEPDRLPISAWLRANHRGVEFQVIGVVVIETMVICGITTEAD